MKPTVLIVDDIAEIRDEIRHWLEPDFLIVGEASDGGEAVQMAKELLPLFVVMDVSMPRTSGIDAVRQMTEEMPRPPKVVMLSGLTEDEVVIAALQAGAHDYLFKPGNADTLRATLAGLMNT